MVFNFFYNIGHFLIPIFSKIQSASILVWSTVGLINYCNRTTLVIEEQEGTKAGSNSGPSTD